MAMVRIQRRCLLAAQNEQPRYRVYKLRRKNGISGGVWRVAFMSMIIAKGQSFDEVILRAKLAVRTEV